jgi:hypothetical protein
MPPDEWKRHSHACKETSRSLHVFGQKTAGVSQLTCFAGLVVVLERSCVSGSKQNEVHNVLVGGGFENMATSPCSSFPFVERSSPCPSIFSRASFFPSVHHFCNNLPGLL